MIGLKTLKHDDHVRRCRHWKRDVVAALRNVSLDAETYFKRIDADGSNGITVEETDIFLKNQTTFKRSLSFSLQKEIVMMDKNNDGLISPEEFDESL